MELDEQSDDDPDNESPVVSDTSMGEGAVGSKEVVSHGPRSKNTEHETYYHGEEVYVDQAPTGAVAAHSIIFAQFLHLKYFLVVLNDEFRLSLNIG